MSNALKTAVAAAALLLASQVQGHAQATRTWVSGVGDDANPCSRTAPCKTFAGAISKTAAHGEISVLDPGGFGTVNITKSISIVSDGSEGSILGCSVNGVIVNAGANDVVNLSGLYFEGCNNGVNGVRIIRARTVTIRKCLIRGFAATANSVGIVVDANISPVDVYVSDCTITKNGRGIQVTRGGGDGVANVHLNRVEVDDNAGVGLRTVGANANIVMSNTHVRGNGTGLLSGGNGPIMSYGNNIVSGNGTDGAPTQTLPMQ
jgi:hypothetical protein